MVNKEYCMSSYLAFRYIEDDNIDFKEGIRHKNFVPMPDKLKIPCRSAKEIDKNISKLFEDLNGKNKKLGIMLSGGMDSAILASYMAGCDAYTFRFLNGEFQGEELKRAEYYANYYHLKLHYVDISWEAVNSILPSIMEEKGAPVHSIEPQILRAALQAKNDGVDTMIIGESSDLVFGGMDQLLSKDWDFEEFVNRYIFTKPEEVLTTPVDMTYLFERYREPNNKIDFIKFLDDVLAIEGSGSYQNAFNVAQLSYCDPYANLKMAEPLDLCRIRNGEPKYLIRELMSQKYPNIPVPNKVPMPRPVDKYFENWAGPKRPEFRKDINMGVLTGNQKWQLYCLEQFLNMID